MHIWGIRLLGESFSVLFFGYVYFYFIIRPNEQKPKRFLNGMEETNVSRLNAKHKCLKQ